MIIPYILISNLIQHKQYYSDISMVFEYQNLNNIKDYMILLYFIDRYCIFDVLNHVILIIHMVTYLILFIR